MGLDRIERSEEDIGPVYEDGRLVMRVVRSACLRWLGGGVRV